MMADLKTRVEELKSENEYQLRLKDMSYNDKIKELTEKFIQEMEALKTKNQVSLLPDSYITNTSSVYFQIHIYFTLHFYKNDILFQLIFLLR
jgi:protein associated with RNAse G/E